MLQKFMLGAYWGARRDSLEESTESSKRFFACVAEVDPLLAQWYEKGRSRKHALTRKVDCSDPAKLRELLLKGRNRRDIGREVIEELGFSLGLWNGAEQHEAGASINIHCGAYGDYVSNAVVLYIPHSANASWTAGASSLLASTAEIWRPRWAGIMSRKARDERYVSGQAPFVDWMVYVPRIIEQVPPPSRVEAVSGLGSVIVVQPDPPVGDDPEELSRIRRIESILSS